MPCLRLSPFLIVAILVVSAHSRLYNDDFLPRNDGLLGRSLLNRNLGGVSIVTRRETQTQTTNHVLTEPSGTIGSDGGLAGSQTGRNVGGLGLTDQYNDRNRMGLGGRSSSLYNYNVVGGLTDGVVGNNYDRF